MRIQLTEPGGDTAPSLEADMAIGIDLGTTNSLVGYADKTGVHLIPFDGGSVLYPSVVRIGNTKLTSIKRLMGKSLQDVEDRGYGHFPVDAEKKTGMVHLKVEDQSLSPVELSAQILAHLKSHAEAYLAKPIEKAVVTVPAYFGEAAKAATRDAAQIAGLEVLRIINEPTAAALAYGLDEGAQGFYAIYDLGGGTFDVSVLKLTNGVFQVLATGGNPNLGGDDFDHLLAKNLLSRSDFPSEHELQEAARHLKESLCTGGKTDCFTLKDFQDLARPLVEETLQIMESTLKDAGLAADKLDGIVLVGGGTRMPFISTLIAEKFNITPLNTVDPDQAVVRGAALQARALTHGGDSLLLDVIPLSLGLETMGGLVEKIIPRNSPIPLAKAQDFTTYEDGQTAMVIHVLQGEREMATDCRSLAHFTLTGIPPMAAGLARIRVTFTVDADGLLSVRAEEKTTGTHQDVVVKPAYGLSAEKVAALLRQSLEVGKEDMERRLLEQARVEGKQIVKAVEQALKSDGDILETELSTRIAQALKGLRQVLKSQDRHAIVQARKALESLTQGFAERRMERQIQIALKGRRPAAV